MSPTNRELVDFFICYKLTQENYPSPLSRLPPSSDFDSVKAALQDSTNEFELRMQNFNGLFSQLDITSDTAHRRFKSIMDELFVDEVHWGRIVALFVVGGALCVECAQKDMSILIPQIADWMTTYMDEHLSPWMESAGGWDSFVESYGQHAADRGQRSQQTPKRWMEVGGAFLTGVLVIVNALRLTVGGKFYQDC